MTKRVSVRWDDFEAAFIIGSPDARYFLNMDSGEVEYTSHMDGETVRKRVLERIKAEPWIEIVRASTPEGMQEIREFIDAEADEGFRESLGASLQERNPLRAFNIALSDDPGARKRWAQARMDGIHRRLLAFCAKHDIEIEHERFGELKKRFAS